MRTYEYTTQLVDAYSGYDGESLPDLCPPEDGFRLHSLVQIYPQQYPDAAAFLAVWERREGDG